MFLQTAFILFFALQTVFMPVNYVLANCIHLVHYALVNFIQASLFFSALGRLIWYHRLGAEPKS